MTCFIIEAFFFFKYLLWPCSTFWSMKKHSYWEQSQCPTLFPLLLHMTTPLWDTVLSVELEMLIRLCSWAGPVLYSHHHPALHSILNHFALNIFWHLAASVLLWKKNLAFVKDGLGEFNVCEVNDCDHYF